MCVRVRVRVRVRVCVRECLRTKKDRHVPSGHLGKKPAVSNNQFISCVCVAVCVCCTLLKRSLIKSLDGNNGEHFVLGFNLTLIYYVYFPKCSLLLACSRV